MIWGKDPKSNHSYNSDSKQRNNWWCCEKILIILLGQVCYKLGSASTYYNNGSGWTCSVFHISVCERGQGGRHGWPPRHPCHHHASSVPDNTTCLLLLIGRRKGGPSQVSAMLMHWGGSRFGYLYTDLPAEDPLANLTATALFSDGLCLVIYSPESYTCKPGTCLGQARVTTYSLDYLINPLTPVHVEIQTSGACPWDSLRLYRGSVICSHIIPDLGCRTCSYASFCMHNYLIMTLSFPIVQGYHIW